MATQGLTLPLNGERRGDLQRRRASCGAARVPAAQGPAAMARGESSAAQGLAGVAWEPVAQGPTGTARGSPASPDGTRREADSR